MTHPIEQDTNQQARIAGYGVLVAASAIATTVLDDVVVDTRWIGMNPARRFIETMILGGAYDGQTVTRPYTDEDDARTTHAAVVEALRAGTSLDGLVA